MPALLTQLQQVGRSTSHSYLLVNLSQAYLFADQKAQLIAAKKFESTISVLGRLNALDAVAGHYGCHSSLDWSRWPQSDWTDIDIQIVLFGQRPRQ